MTRKPSELSAIELSALGANAAFEAVNKTYDLNSKAKVPSRNIEEFGGAPPELKPSKHRVAHKVA